MNLDAWWLAALSLALAALAMTLLAWILVRGLREDEMIGRRIGSIFGDTGSGSATRSPGRRPLMFEQARALDPTEVARLLAQAGYPRPDHRRVFATVANLLPAAVGLLGFLWLSMTGRLESQALAGLGIVVILALLLPKRILAVLAARRQARIGQETGLFIQLLRMLLEAGLSLEHALRVIVAEARLLLPDTAFELELCLQRVSSGQGLSEALEETSRTLGVPEWDDTVPILRQFMQQGGAVRGPLAKLGALILDRQETRLQERISKMAGKMSVVMMVFLFPALLVFLTAPGLIALARGLMGLGDG